MPRPPQHRLPRTQYFAPVGFTHFHPCHLNAADRARIRRRFNPRGIFLNIPYAAAYTQLELATISTATAYELTPKGWTPEEAYVFCSLACDLRVTQLVDGNKGIHAMVSRDLLASSPAVTPAAAPWR